MAGSDRDRYLQNLQGELDGIALYSALATIESSPQLQQVYRQLAESEERHAEVWRKHLRDIGVTDLPTQPGWRTKTLISLARRFGPSFILPTVMSTEKADSEKYASQEEATEAGMVGDERSHARLFQSMSGDGSGGVAGATIARLEGRHRSGGNALRAAVLGANDGLVSNASLVMGVAGAELAGSQILVTGLAGLLAGSLSMALGEWLSVQSARELFEHQVGIERAELEASPEEEAEELALIYQSKGLSLEESRRLATQIIGDGRSALDTLAREELGIDPEELGGSAWVAAGTSFLLFAVGAIIPVLPFFFTSGMRAVIVSLVLSVIALFAIGAGITVITGKNALWSGARQVAFGLIAVAITYGVGRLVGVSIGG